MKVLAIWLGYVVMTAGGMGITAGLLIYAAAWLNRAVWVFIESYGGVKTFMEFRKWYQAKEEINK